jgi:leucyl aminopeptidase
MEFALIAAAHPAQAAAGAIIIPATTDGLTAAGKTLDAASEGRLTAILTNAGFEGKTGQTLPVFGLPGLESRQIIVVGAGDAKDLNNRAFQKTAAAAFKALNSKIRTVVSYLGELRVQNRTPAQTLADIVRVTQEAAYRFDHYKSKKSTEPGLEKMMLAVADEAELAAGQTAIAWGEAVACGQNLARDLGNQPPNICHPTYLAEQAKALVKGQRKMKLDVLGESDMEKLGMGAFLAVSKGSVEEGKLIVIEYHGGKKGDKPVVLVGKGITFDTGGISLKPGAAMDEMKYDMCGAASVLGVMQGLAASQLPINVVGVIAAAENMPAGNATRPGDIVTTMSGQTVEILNTDAEGRLVLCDALTYIKRFDPAVVIDIATLTGACVVALGKVVSGLFTPHDELAEALLNAGLAGNDRTWRMPVLPDYQELLDSPFADMANISSGGPNGGAITAACFLERFTKDYTWAHLDIAGVAWISGAQKGATGRPVPLLMQYLHDCVAG